MRQDNLGRWSVSSVLRCFEFEGIAGELQGRHLLHRDVQQPGKGVGLDLHVFAARYRDAERATCVPEGVALQEDAVALGHLEVRVVRAEVLKGLPLGDHAVDPGNVDVFQRRAPAERARLYPQLAAVRDLKVHRVRRDHPLQQLHVLGKRKSRREMKRNAKPRGDVQQV